MTNTEQLTLSNNSKLRESVLAKRERLAYPLLIAIALLNKHSTDEFSKLNAPFKLKFGGKDTV